MAFFPMMVSTENQNVIVIGGGEEGLKKIRILRSFGALITLVAPDALPEAIQLSNVFHKKKFSSEDLEVQDYMLVVSATNDREVNSLVSSLAKAKRIPVNVVDDTELCTFIFPAIIKENDLVCAVSSAGKSPYVAQYVKGLIQECLPPQIGMINDQIGEYRESVKNEISDVVKRREALKNKLDSLIEDLNH